MRRVSHRRRSHDPRGARTARHGPATARARDSVAAAPDPALPLRHPAAVFAIAVAALCAIVSVSYRLYDTDLWLLLAHGRVIAESRRIPHEILWTWPGYGTPDPAASWWAFRLLAWWLWTAGGVPALFAWRWLSTLAAFGILWATARRMGARGLLPLVTTTLCVLAYRIRSDIRPETLSAVLFAAVLWLLEADRTDAGERGARAPGTGPRRRWRIWLIVPIAFLWANTHIGWYVGFVLLGAHLVQACVVARRGPGREAATARARRLTFVGLTALAVSFLNPTGWRALAQPFEFALFWREEPLYRLIGELHPLIWSTHLRDGLPVLMLGWPLLLLWRARRKGLDLVEALLCLFFTAVAVSSQRFLGSYALAAAPYVARDLDARVTTLGRPAWLAGAVVRGFVGAVACVAISLPEWTRPDLPLGLGLDLSGVPVAACDFLRDHGVRGRGFNPFHFGGYLAFRAGADRGRLPFMSTQPEQTPRADRLLYPRIFGDPAAWRALDGRHRFEYLVLDREQDPGDRLPDFLDRDTSWVMVFGDDAAEVLVRRHGRFAALADSLGYRVLPAGRVARAALLAACASDSVLLGRASAELRRQVAASPWDGRAHQLLGILAARAGRTAEARVHVERALEREPLLPGLHELLGLIALEQGRAREALREFQRERSLHGERRRLDFELGRAWQGLGQPSRARAAYAREVRLDPANAEARDSLEALGGAR